MTTFHHFCLLLLLGSCFDPSTIQAAPRPESPATNGTTALPLQPSMALPAKPTPPPPSLDQELKGLIEMLGKVATADELAGTPKPPDKPVERTEGR